MGIPAGGWPAALTNGSGLWPAQRKHPRKNRGRRESWGYPLRYKSREQFGVAPRSGEQAGPSPSHEACATARPGRSEREAQCQLPRGGFVAALASLIALTLALLMAGCAPIDLRGTGTEYKPPFIGTDATTPELLEYLIDWGIWYRKERASLQARLAYAEKLQDTPQKTATRDNPWAPLGSGIDRAVGGIAARRIQGEIAELDGEWHRLLLDMLGNAPGVLDFDSRAVTLGLSPEQVQPYWALFQIHQRPPGA